MRRSAAVLLALALAALACAGPLARPTQAPTNIETMVAGTLTALAPTATRATAQPATAQAATALPASPTAPAPPTSTAPAEFTCALAYADSGSLFCIGQDGLVQLLVALGGGRSLFRPSISPDGRWVAYQVGVTEDVSELWAVGADPRASPPRVLMNAGTMPNSTPALLNSPQDYAWRAGTHSLIFSTHYTPNGPHGPGDFNNYDLWRVEAESAALTPLLPAGSGGAFAVSPNGAFIAIARPTGLDLVNADGSNYRKDLISFPSIITYSEYLYKPAPTWSPDSTFFGVAVPSVDPLAPDTSLALYRVGADGVVQPLANLPGNFVFGGAVRPTFSPDGQYLVYSRAQGANGMDDLHLVALAGAVDDQVVAQVAGTGGWGWSPDSQRFAYASIPGASTLGSGYLLGLDHSARPFAPALTAVLDLQWLDATTLAFLGQINNGSWSLYKLTLGQEPLLLANNLTQQASLAVRPSASQG